MEVPTQKSSTGAAGSKMTETPRFQRQKTMLFSSTTHEDDIEAGKFDIKDLDVDETRICDELNCHLRFKVKEGYEMKNLPKFDDLTRYNIREDQEIQLWTLEVRRLVAVVKSQTPPSLEGPLEWYGKTDHDGYNRLSTLAHAILYSADVCVHDNELIMLEHCAWWANVKTYTGIHRRLLKVFDPEEESVRYDRKIRLDEQHDELFHALVNYLTAIIAYTLVRTMKARFWTDNCISTLAKFAAKLKVVGVDLPRAVSRTIEAQKDFQIQTSGLARTRQTNFSSQQTNSGTQHDDSAKETEDTNRRKALQDISDTSGARYFFVMDIFRHHIGALLRVPCTDLLWNEEIDQTGDIFETSAIIYDTGFQNIKTHMCQERDGSIGSTVDLNVIRCASVAFEVCISVWMGLSSTDEPAWPRTSIIWNRSELSHSGDIISTSPGHKTLTSMKQVITAMVPYLMFCGTAPTALAAFTSGIIFQTDPTNPVQRYTQPNILAAARIRTSQYDTAHRQRPDGAKFRNLFDTSIAEVGAFAGEIRDERRPLDELKDQHRATRLRITDTMTQVDKWIIDERSIVISDIWYSWVVLFAVGVLVTGALVLVAVQDKIAGVDPSNLSVLVWTAAGFLVVYFKSRRVENWPWRDFLRGRVVCRSVSEVHAVTKIDPQLLLAVLLRCETRMFLHKRGPFNALFELQSDDGFAIDVPPLTETAISGGHTFLMVDSFYGPALVGLRAKKWEGYKSFSPRDEKRGEGFICRDLRDPGSYSLPLSERRTGQASSKATEILPLYHIRTSDLEWYRVQGVFVQKAVFG
ncbi:hypothetical protein F4680DRAFT_402359 [Xylaria scruposa]|nr:hypothetical protein F4680DRAFT_402359 [Xylaria scruposa]